MQIQISAHWSIVSLLSDTAGLVFFMGNSYNPEQELTVSHDVLASHHTAVIPLVTTTPGGAALFIFF